MTQAERIEEFLLARRGWVSTQELCDRFQVNARALRASGKTPGLCSDCAISSDRGFRHVHTATAAEFDSAYGRMRRHGLGELAHARQLLNKRQAKPAAPPPPPVTFEPSSDQALLLPTP